MTGFGRTGATFGSVRFNIVPDIITFAKGVTSAYAPLGGVDDPREARADVRHAAPRRRSYLQRTPAQHGGGNRRDRSLPRRRVLRTRPHDRRLAPHQTRQTQRQTRVDRRRARSGRLLCARVRFRPGEAHAADSVAGQEPGCDAGALRCVAQRRGVRVRPLQHYSYRAAAGHRRSPSSTKRWQRSMPRSANSRTPTPPRRSSA